jgi:apolipoprotein N-acyltransferase
MLDKRRYLLLVYCAALLGVSAYQPFDIWPAALVFVALLMYACRGKSAAGAFWTGYLFGAIFYITLLYWIAWATFFGMLPVPFILAVIPAVFCYLFHHLKKINEILALVMAPFIWVFLEYIRTLGQLAFPWNPVGNCFAAYPEFIQYAEFTGVWGISLWALIINILFYILLTRRFRFKRTVWLAGTIIILTAAPYIYGVSVIPDEIKKGDVTIAVIQGNIPREVKWEKGKLYVSLDTYFSMTDSLRGSDVDLILWPETALPCYLRERRAYNENVKRLAEDVGIPILTGAPDYKKIGPDHYIYYNSALFYKPDLSEPAVYTKTKLVPFSERIPFSGKVKVLRDIHLGQADFSPGDSLVLFDLDGKHFGVLICFELVFPDLVRSFVERGADFMVTITNDMWFGITSGPYQHYYSGTIRAVENRIGIARSANTGISLFYDPYGRTYDTSRLNERTTLVNSIATAEKRTFYNRHGDYLGKWSALITGLAVIIIIFDYFMSPSEPNLRKENEV